MRIQIAHSLGISEQLVHCTLDGDVVVVTVAGELAGRSVKNAMRRRQKVLRVAKRTIAGRNVRLSLTFAVRDAVATIEDLVRTTAALVLGYPPEAVSLKVGRTGEASILVAISKDDDRASDELTKVIAPIFHRFGLSLAGVTLVSPMREDVSDARLLRAAKILAPCDSVAVARRLKELDDIEIAPDLVHRRLDLLRQKGLLTYLGGRRFALTLSGLAVVPISTSRRDSSDIQRVLALARRKW
jgi:hypothetical protein